MAAREDVTLAERVRSVYEEVWHEFFDWEQEFCAQTLASLAPESQHDSESEAPSPPPGPSTPQTTDETYIDIDCVQVSRFYPDGDADLEALPCPTYTCPSLEPAKPYEACTFVHKNIYVADDGGEKLQFMPFSDDPAFPAQELFELYDSMAWESPKDPDYDMIAAEAARRLHFGFGFSYADIDSTGILPRAIVEQPDKKGLLHMLNQRDMLPWPGALLSQLPPLPRTEGPLPTALRKRVNGLRYLFCANLNCVEPYCPTHLNMDGQVRNTADDWTDGDAKGARDAPCGYDCYKYAAHEAEGLTAWSDAQLADFKFILEGASDLSSCDLAVLCDKPCRDVYAHRRIHAPRPPSPSGTDSSDLTSLDSSAGSDKPIFDDTVRGPNAAKALPPSEICQHLGECSAKADCRCFRKNLHCHRNCQCSLSCRRRVKGCRCKNHGRARCRTVKCPCFKAGRECDPELCQKCSARDATKAGACRNNDLQHGKAKALEVKEGAYGLGLFLLETAREGDLIGEYVGEIVNDKMTDARGVLTRYLGRNYLFGLNAEWTLDAGLVGNETRFINHARGAGANCRAEVREVNGDHRIGIFAVKKVIEAGEELFMDYGKEYFVET